MATLRQIAANRQNARQSTGPKSEQGKAHSRANALKHGLAGDGVVTPDDDAGQIAQRLETWRSSYVIATDEDEWLFTQYIVNTVRIDRCQRQETALRAHEAGRAELCWDDDRRLVAEQIGDALKRRPAITVSRLCTTRQGCDWLLERWRGLLAIVERAGEWTEPQRGLAFDLLGTDPDLRMEHPWSLDDTAGEMAKRQIAAIEQLQAQSLDELDALEQSAAVDGLPIEPSRAMTLLKRYEAACIRRMQGARNRLVSVHRAKAPQSAPEPTPAPAPRPRRQFAPSPPSPGPISDALTAFERGWIACGADEGEAAELAPLHERPTATEPARAILPALTPPPRPLNRKMRRAAMKLAGRK
jgi:hypothetical protein